MPEPDKKALAQPRKWALITLHPWLPSKSEQIARARAWGVDESTLHGADVSALFVDDVRKIGRTTNPGKHLIERARFIHVMSKFRPREDQVFFANPLCVGWTPKLAGETIHALWDAGLSIYVHSLKDNGSALYQQGDDLGDFLESVRLLANAAHQAAWRGRKSQ